MIKFLFVLSSLVSNGYATPVAHESVFNQVLKNHPTIDKEYANQLAMIIQKMADEYNLPSRTLAAILAQESKYKLDTKNCDTGKCTDFGISQIHFRTIKAYGFNKKRLLTDLEYSIEAGAIVLSDIKRMYGEKDPYYWSRYNARKPEFRREYERLVMRYM